MDRAEQIMEFNDEFNNFMRMKMNPNSYPRVDYGKNLCERDYENNPTLSIVDRIQIQFDPTRFAFIMRHLTRHHWSGYILTTESEWQANAESIMAAAPAVINFAMPAYEPICWMGVNTNAALKSPMEITKDDFWIGFDMLAFGPRVAMQQDRALETLISMEQRVDRVRHGHTPT